MRDTQLGIMFANTTDADVLSIAHENVSQTEGALVPEGGGRKPIILAIFFCRKRHENEGNWTVG